jgi:hypothetical protein
MHSIDCISGSRTVRGHSIRFRATLDDSVWTVRVIHPDGEIEEGTSLHVWDVLPEMLDDAIASVDELPPRRQGT